MAFDTIAAISGTIKRTFNKALARTVVHRGAVHEANAESSPSRTSDVLLPEESSDIISRTTEASTDGPPTPVVSSPRETLSADVLTDRDEIAGDDGNETILSTEALLPLPRDLLMKLQTTIRVGHVIASFDEWAQRKLAANAEYRLKVDEETDRQSRLLSTLETRSESDFAAQANHVSIKLEKLLAMRQTVDDDDEGVVKALQDKYNSYSNLQSGTLTALSDLAIQHGLCEQIEEDIEVSVDEVDFEAAYGYPIDTTEETGPLDPADTTEETDVRELYLQCLHQLAIAQEQFDDKDLFEAEEEAAIERAWHETGQPLEESPEEVSHRHLLRKMELTRNLIEAEEAFAIAKDIAIEAGVRIGDEDDEEEDEDEECDEENVLERETAEKHEGVGFDDWSPDVRTWVAGLPVDEQEFHDPMFVIFDRSSAEWPSNCPEHIEIWESGTDIAWDWRAEKIVDWHKKCGVSIRNSRGRALSV